MSDVHFFKAYEKWLETNNSVGEEEYLPGLNMTAKQLFFLSFGQIWCGMLFIIIQYYYYQLITLLFKKGAEQFAQKQHCQKSKLLFILRDVSGIKRITAVM